MTISSGKCVASTCIKLRKFLNIFADNTAPFCELTAITMFREKADALRVKMRAREKEHAWQEITSLSFTSVSFPGTALEFFFSHGFPCIPRPTFNFFFPSTSLRAKLAGSGAPSSLMKTKQYL